MNIDKEMIRPIKTYIHVFNGAKVKPLGVIELPVYAVDQMIGVKFLVEILFQQ